MEAILREKIPLLKNAGHIQQINKGFSFDRKYVIDEKYLLRLFSSEDEANRYEEFNTIKKLTTFSSYVPDAIEFGCLKQMGLSYMILTYFPGTDAEVALEDLSENAQFEAGIHAGKELKRLHGLDAPSHLPEWYVQKKKKTDKYITQLENVPVEKSMKEMLTTYIKDNEKWMRNRPNTFQHDDFHPANLLIHNKTFSGIIDFQRMDWGDPLHDLHKLGFFSSRISIPFTNGIIDGYHADTGLDNTFWELYTLYSAMNIVSSLVWGIKMDNFDTMLAYSRDVIKDHGDFKRIVPKWYT